MRDGAVLREVVDALRWRRKSISESTTPERPQTLRPSRIILMEMGSMLCSTVMELGMSTSLSYASSCVALSARRGDPPKGTLPW